MGYIPNINILPERFDNGTVEGPQPTPVDLSSGCIQKFTLVESVEIWAPPVNPIIGTYVYIIQQGEGGGAAVFGWDLDFYKWPGGEAPVLSVEPNAIDVITFVYDGTSFYGAILKTFS